MFYFGLADRVKHVLLRRMEELDERSDRIIRVAMELAERDGFDAVRLRDLAAKADVALGTVYRRFSCKEDILAAALAQQVQLLKQGVESHPFEGDTPQERLTVFFTNVTGLLSDQPKLTSAMLRTVASGVPELAERVLRYQDTMAEIIVIVMRGEGAQGAPSDDEIFLSKMLQNIWFAAMVGWTGGLFGPEEVTRQVVQAMGVLIKGLEA